MTWRISGSARTLRPGTEIVTAIIEPGALSRASQALEACDVDTVVPTNRYPHLRLDEARTMGLQAAQQVHPCCTGSGLRARREVKHEPAAGS
jgi:hypothetical protein